MSAIDKLLQSDSVGSFGTGSIAQIKAYQKQYGIRFSGEYQNFLVRCNGMSTSFDWELPEKLGMARALTGINTFYGIGNGRDYSDLAIMTRLYDENRLRMMAFAPSIAVGGDLCEFVEISQGKRIDQIIYTDGEMYWHIVENTDWSRSPDDLIEEFIEDGFYMPVADSFAELLAMYLVLVDHASS